jgi:hypothetical protein
MRMVGRVIGRRAEILSHVALREVSREAHAPVTEGSDAMRRIRSLAGLTVVFVAVAAPSVTSAQGAARRGVVLGGVTKDGWPVVLQMTRNVKTVRRAVMAIRTQCTSGQSFIDHDTYVKLRVGKSGRFSSSFGPETNPTPPAPGITEIAQGSISGRFNKARTRVSGTWRLTFVDKNAAGATTNTCDSGMVAWHAQQ